MTPVGVHYQLVGSSLSTWWEFTINSVGVYYKLCGSLLPTWWEFTIKLVGVYYQVGGRTQELVGRREEVADMLENARCLSTQGEFHTDPHGVYYELGGSLLSTWFNINKIDSKP